MDSAAEIGQRIVELRGERGQKDFAEALGVHKNTLSRYERGERSPDSEFLVRLTRLGYNPTWVLIGDGRRDLTSNEVEAAELMVRDVIGSDPKAVKAREAGGQFYEATMERLRQRLNRARALVDEGLRVTGFEPQRFLLEVLYTVAQSEDMDAERLRLLIEAIKAEIDSSRTEPPERRATS